MKKIIINGYNSYIGNNFYNQFKKKNKIYYYKRDINQISNLKKYLKNKKFDTFVHFAGLSREKCLINKMKCLKSNYYAIKKIIDYLNTLHKKPYFIFISSSHVYKFSSKKIKENFLKKPRDRYGKLKLKSENYIIKNYKKHCILRLFNVYGKNQPESYFVPDLKKKISLDQIIHIDNSVRDFLNVNNVVKAINLMVQKNVIGTVNIGSGRATKLKSIINKIALQIKKKPKLKLSTKKTQLVADISLLKSYGIKFVKNEKNFDF